MYQKDELQSASESGPLFQEQTNISINQSSLLLENTKDFFYWWYIQMPIYYALTFRRINVVLKDKLSIQLLLKHFTTPWQRRYELPFIILGLIIKILYLPIAIVFYYLIMLFVIALFLLWLLLPMVSIFALILAPIIQ